MTKYIFLNIPIQGDVNPTLAVAQELVKRGHEVSYYLTERFKGAIQATGATFHSYETQLDDVQMLPLEMVNESRHVLPQVLDRIRAEQPDYIVYGSMCIWARIVTQVLNVPAIVLRMTYMMDERVFSIMRRHHEEEFSEVFKAIAKIDIDLAELCETYHVPPFNLSTAFAHADELVILFFPKAFQPFGETFDEHYLFVGPSILPRHKESDFPLDQLSDKLPILYISLGTIFNDSPEFFKMCFEAFGKQPWQVVLSIGKQVDPAILGPIPDNFLIAPYVPQLEVLPRTQVFVNHGGMNSVMESLYYGVPMVSIPQMVEQEIPAQCIAELRLGVMLEKDAVSVTTLREAVERVANEASFRERAQSMQRITHEAGGCQRAADAIIRFAEERARVH